MYKVLDKMPIKIIKYVIFVSKTLNMAFLSQKHDPSVNFVDLLNAPKSCKKGFLKTPWGEGGSLFMFVKSAAIWWSNLE